MLPVGCTLLFPSVTWLAKHCTAEPRLGLHSVWQYWQYWLLYLWQAPLAAVLMASSTDCCTYGKLYWLLYLWQALHCIYL